MPLSYVITNGNGATTNFAVPFSYLSKSHVHVYVGGVETLALTWINSSTIQITPAPPAGSQNVEIRRLTPRDQPLVDYNDGSVLFATDLDTANLQALFISQEYFEQTAEDTPSGHSIDSHTDGTPSAGVAKGTLRIYDVNSKFNAIPPPADGDLLIGDTADNKGARWLPKGTDGYVLEVEDATAGKISWKQGLRKLATAAGDLLYATASGVMARLGVGTTGLVLSSTGSAPAWEHRGFTTGDVKVTLKTVADAGWVMMDDGTIGSSSSGATTRANADTQPLFELLWNNTADGNCAVSGGRGASASADFSANKTIALPKTLGRALANSGAGAGLTSRALALAMGAEHALVISHTHSITDPGHSHNERIDASLDGTGSGLVVTGVTNETTANQDGTSNVTSTNATGISINATGSSGTDMNIQPTTFLNLMIKL